MVCAKCGCNRVIRNVMHQYLGTSQVRMPDLNSSLVSFFFLLNDNINQPASFVIIVIDRVIGLVLQ